MAVSEVVMAAVSVVAGPMADVSAPDVVPFLSPQPASTRTAVINRIVFIVAPSGGSWRGLQCPGTRMGRAPVGEGTYRSSFVQGDSPCRPEYETNQAMIEPRTFGELKNSRWAETPLRGRSVREEIRSNLLVRLSSDKPLFPGIVGYEDTILPQIVNALLARHHFILLGLRGQAKSRILRELTGL